MPKVPFVLLPTALVLWACLAVGCEQNALLADDLSAARTAVAERNWPLAERLLERCLREEQSPDKRWEAWQQLLTVVNSANPEARATLDYLEAMLAEYADDDARVKLVLERMGRLNESLRRYERAADAWSAYIGLAGLTPRETVEGYRHLASVQFSQRRFEAGEETLQQCLNMARERWQEVADLCQQILDSGPDKELRGLSGYLLGDALEQLGKGAEALKQFELARDEYPNPSVMDNRIAHLRNKLKKQAK